MATRLDEVLHGSEGAHVVVHHHARGLHACANAVVEYQGNPVLHEFLEVVVLLGVFSL